MGAALFVLYTVPIGLSLGLLLALLAHQQLAGIRFFRTVFASTVATSVAVASVIFFTLLNPQVGLFSYWPNVDELSVLDDPDRPSWRSPSSRSGRTLAFRSS